MTAYRVTEKGAELGFYINKSGIHGLGQCVWGGPFDSGTTVANLGGWDSARRHRLIRDGWEAAGWIEKIQMPGRFDLTTSVGFMIGRKNDAGDKRRILIEDDDAGTQTYRWVTKTDIHRLISWLQQVDTAWD